MSEEQDYVEMLRARSLNKINQSMGMRGGAPSADAVTSFALCNLWLKFNASAAKTAPEFEALSDADQEVAMLRSRSLNAMKDARGMGPDNETILNFVKCDLWLKSQP